MFAVILASFITAQLVGSSAQGGRGLISFGALNRLVIEPTIHEFI